MQVDSYESPTNLHSFEKPEQMHLGMQPLNQSQKL